MSKVLVDRELLERCVERWACCAIVETPGAEAAWLELRNFMKSAQPAEAEGVKVVAYVGCEARMTTDGWENGKEYLVFADQASDADKRYDVPLMTVAQHLAALSAVTAERDRLREENERLKRAAQTNWNEFADSVGDRDRLSAEVEALRKDASRLDRLDVECEAYGCEGIHEGNRWMIDGPFRTVRDAIDDAMAAKEA